MNKRASLGLHTKQERTHAASMAKARFDFAMNRADSEPAYLVFAEGYIQAIRDLAVTEANEDKEFITYLEQLLVKLQMKGSGS